MLSLISKFRYQITLTIGMILSVLQPVHAQFYELGINKAHFAVNEQIAVSYNAFGGYNQDWICLVTAGAPENTYSQWFYTGGNTQGTMNFKGLPAGTYEVRAYANWPVGKYHIRNSKTFSVGGTQVHLGGALTGGSFSGTWTTGYGAMHLTQIGNRVHGYYGNKSLGKIIEGEIVSNRLIGTWGRTNSTNWGQIEFVLNTQASAFEGYWRTGESGTWVGWDGQRK